MSEQSDTLQVYLSQRAELVRYAATITGDMVEAEDVVQEAWLRFREIARSRLLDEPKGYLYRIVRNLALDGRRRNGLERRIFADNAMDVAMDVASDAPSLHALVEARHELEIIRQALGALPPRTRSAFEMHRFQGMKLIDIAAHLGISKSLAQELVIDGVEHCKKALRRPS